MKIASYDSHAINDGTNYIAHFIDDPLPYGLPPVSATNLPRPGRWPLVAGVQRGELIRQMAIYIRAGTPAQLASWLDYEDETPKVLAVTDPDGSDTRYWYAICRSLREVPYRAGKKYIATFQIHGDPRLRKAAVGEIWTTVRGGDINTLNNGGPDRAFPHVIRIQPTKAKTGGYAYRKWIKVKWPVSDSASQHPTDICDDSFNTFALVGGAKMQADGDDLRVWVDGAEVDRWLDGINGLTTKVWVNLDWQPKQTATLDTAIAGAGAVTDIVVNESILDFPDSGFLEIGSEIFTYTSKSNALKTFSGCTRAQRGSSAAAHSAGDAVEWIQHDIWILYGNSSATAPDTDDTKKPIFNLSTSTNGSWDYDEFGSADPRTGQWAFISYSNGTTKYTANQGANADPYSEMGIYDNYNADGMWYIRHPCLISNVNFQNGEKYSANLGGIWDAGIVSWDDGGTGFTTEDTIAEPATVSTWGSWSDSEAIANKKHVGFYLRCVDNLVAVRRLEVADVTLTIANTPTITLGSEVSNYDLDCILTNNDTGQAIRVTRAFMSLNDQIQIDTYNFQVYDYANDEPAYSALSLVGGPRRDWFYLAPGDNDIQFDEDGAGEVTITIEWDERHYE